jgi:2-C-methyl-D-erythritol 4-phosphate cytidylyltransferase
MLPRMEGAHAVAVVVAAGSGTRLGTDGPKALIAIGGRPLVAVAVEGALSSPSIGGVVVAAPQGFEERILETLAPGAGSIVVVTGGATRQRSVATGLNAVDAHVDVVVVHDAARPFASPELFTAVVDAVLAGADAAVPVLPLVDTVKRVRDGSIVGTEHREELALAQTPQACRTGLLRDGLAKAEESGLDFTDDAGLLEWAGASVRTVPGEPGNFKITSAKDLARADEILGAGRA